MRNILEKLLDVKFGLTHVQHIFVLSVEIVHVGESGVVHVGHVFHHVSHLVLSYYVPLMQKLHVHWVGNLLFDSFLSSLDFFGEGIDGVAGHSLSEHLNHLINEWVLGFELQLVLHPQLSILPKLPLAHQFLERALFVRKGVDMVDLQVSLLLLKAMDSTDVGVVIQPVVD